MEEIIGRLAEKEILADMLGSKEAELLAIFGRRRVGKTFLIRTFYSKNIVFEYTGIHNATLTQQLTNFSLAIKQASNSPIPPVTPASWIEAFNYLSESLKRKIRKVPVVILLDELPWIHTPKSGFLQAFGHWWNTWASREPLVKVVICGSAASWMIANVLNDKGGLHNRVTRKIRLLPFTLGESEQYLTSRNIRLGRYQLIQLYMALGGIPQYLKQIRAAESAAQTIDRLCFTENHQMKSEFDTLYKSLFTNSEYHETVVEALSRKSKGMTRKEIIKACGFTTGGWTTKLFQELEESGFITQYIPFDKTARDSIYKLTDEYTIFYLIFLKNTRATGKGTWLKLSASRSYQSWSGFAFETICQKHVLPVRRALGISGVYTEVSAWRQIGVKEATGVQIDLLLDRKDHCINLCEIKFSTDEFVINKKYAEELDNKIRIFRESTKTRKTIFLTMITTHGTKQNLYSTGRVVAEVTMDDLFKY